MARKTSSNLRSGPHPHGDTPREEATEPAEALPPYSDAELERSLSTLIGEDAAMDGSNVSIHVVDGVAQLSGEVATASEVERAGEIAEGLPGLTAVHNALIVRSGSH
ncbi:BON domain-containing protein [Georhizobium sp. MAB10]|jgi:osmotically-inducible protein OsmY|uniref:BON domain-containing protein n=1 Tax=Georhizobium sp. MAB10 TaxID=3028319 RepID=UPI0038560CFC